MAERSVSVLGVSVAVAGAFVYAAGLQLPFFAYGREAGERLSYGDYLDLVAASGEGSGSVVLLPVLLVAVAAASFPSPGVARAAGLAAVLASVVGVGSLVGSVLVARSEWFLRAGDGFAVPAGPGFYLRVAGVLALGAGALLLCRGRGFRGPVRAGRRSGG
ncbi:hypothetical protein [Salininema proteolyticum]|uniref:DUF1772 domain-containing protein n=1 Tax=Salininema proteolyticum TaxID=1607685 RepID=A0ABV8U3T8_9ACTN